jgi:hypothetical protein
VQVTGFDPTQAPAWHVSACVHALPSLQAVPFGAAGFEHVPVLGLHVPATWHWSEAAHVTGLEPTHVPAWHMFVCMHALVPVHAVPSAFAGFEHLPLVGSQVPAT